MSDFMIRFLLCNLLISGIIGIFVILKRILRNHLSSRMQYNLWFFLLGLLAIPLLPLQLMGFPQMFSWITILKDSSEASMQSAVNPVAAVSASTSNWMNDFTISMNKGIDFPMGYVLLGIWILGIIAMSILTFKSFLRLRRLEASALPLQNSNVYRLYELCLREMGIKKEIPIYSTAFLKSPIIVGLVRPRIYLPIHLISDYQKSDIRYMLLHELQHYKHKDALANYLMNLAGIIYWFNPLIWYAFKEMRNDREVACDTSVLQMLGENDYIDYGTTLINFAEKISLFPFPFAAGISGNRKQMQRRILNIASYKNPTIFNKIKSVSIFLSIAVLLLGFAPFVSTYAADTKDYHWNPSSENVSSTDLSSYFGDYKGSFVFYDSNMDTWKIHDIDQATLRVSPDSTYKIYDALFALEEGIITPEDSFLPWNGETYAFKAWNKDQTLPSAMSSSVNWYFQRLDEGLGKNTVQHYIKDLGYGNQDVSDNLATYWLESSLKISPIEQVELLQSLRNNSFGFSTNTINAVKDAIKLSSTGFGTMYGKTGTGNVNGQNINGWFIGYIETTDNTYYFATNIKATAEATGSKATQITMSILSDMNIWD